MKNIKKLAERYNQLCKQARNNADEIGKLIIDICKPIIKDIEYSVGDEDFGIETILFNSRIRNDADMFGLSNRAMNKYVSFVSLIKKIIPELEGHIRTIHGIWLTRKEAEKIKEVLIKKKEGKK